MVRRGIECAKRTQVHAEWDEMNLVARGDVMAVGQFVRLLLGQDANTVGEQGQRALEQANGPTHRTRKVMIQHVAVEGMHDHWNAGQPGGNPSQNASLGGVGVDNRRPLAPQEQVKADQRPKVVPGGNRAGHFRNRVHGVALAQQVRHVSVLPVRAAGHQNGRIAEFGKLARE